MTIIPEKRYFPMATALACSLAFAGCGGSDGGVNSVATAPPPSAPSSPASVNITTFSSPATRQGTYDTIALIDRGGPLPGPSTNRLAAPGEIRIITYQSSANPGERSYTLDFPTAHLPGGQTSFTGAMPIWNISTPAGPIGLKIGDQATYTFGSGSGSVSRLQDESVTTSTDLGDGKSLQSRLVYNVGLSYVSLGQWDWWVSDRATGNTEEYDSAYFVNGDRTAPGAVPVSGTATYVGQSLGISTDVSNRGGEVGAPIDISLTADFGQRSIAADLNRASATWGDAVGGYTSVAAVDLHGTGAIGTPGTFAIPLAGTVDTTPVTGSLNGTFFGPSAQQVGGVFAVGTAPGQSLVRDAFVAARTGP